MSKIIFITGSTDGIGKLTAIKLAKDGHSILIHGRNSDKLQVVISEIKSISGNEKIKGYVADFSNLESVSIMAKLVLQDYPKLDVLINNAGIFKTSSSKTVNGLDIRFSVNYFAPYRLTNILLPLLEKSSSARIINLSSAAQFPISLKALAGNIELSAQEAYAQSKLALTMWSFYQAKEKANIGIIAVNPGSLLNTKMVKEAYGKHWSSADKGADILYDLAVSNDYDGISGKYFDNDKGNPKGAFGIAHEDAYDLEKINQLITTTESILKLR